MKIFIRAAHLEDSEFIANLSDQLGYKNTIENTLSRLTELLLSKNDCVFVACDENILVGWIHAFKSLKVESDPFIEIGGLVVDVDYRKKGIAKLLINEVISWSQSKNIAKLRMRSNSIRIETHEFYRHLGFKELKTQKVFDLYL